MATALPVAVHPPLQGSARLWGTLALSLAIKEMHGDNTKTEYRTRYNRDVPFHPKPLQPNTRKMEPVKLVY